MEVKIQSLLEISTWELEALSSEVISNKWGFRIKDLNENIVRYEAWLVIKGFSQKPGIVFKQTILEVAALMKQF